jgi:hypothetical protein
VKLRTFAFVLPSAAVVALACSAPAALLPEGGECQQASDCQAGLVCIPQKDGTRVCSSDLSQIQNSEVDAGKDSGMMATGDGAPPRDGTVQDVAPPPKDVGPPPQDTSPPPQDTGPPPQDTGPPPMDSGPPPMDAGMDTGGGGMDASGD